MRFTEKIRFEVMKKADFRCCRCHMLAVEVHHVVPKGKGGPDTFENAAPLCPTCHHWFGDNPTMRKQIRQMRDVWYERVAEEAKTIPLKMEEINRSLLKFEKKLGMRFESGIGALQKEVEGIRVDLGKLSRDAKIAGDPVLAGKVQILESRATAVSGALVSGGMIAVTASLRIPECPKCRTRDLSSNSTLVIGGPHLPTAYRCNKCGFSWTEP
jgi:hypothetical protein